MVVIQAQLLDIYICRRYLINLANVSEVKLDDFDGFVRIALVLLGLARGERIGRLWVVPCEQF